MCKLCLKDARGEERNAVWAMAVGGGMQGPDPTRYQGAAFNVRSTLHCRVGVGAVNILFRAKQQNVPYMGYPMICNLLTNR